ncbi:MAG: gfo/Idh/MocA family oxidoreductase, partial [Bacteroidales bacterium]|nr:gfo/Idh/MocA family oxidoreductase [Bacteroidales bacterium]
MQELIERFKNIRKRNFINAAPKGQYAFVGIGNHSISNLYPIINYLRVDLKYIVTHTKANAKLISDNFNDIIGTDNF